MNDGVHDVTWGDILAVVQNSPHGSAIHRHFEPEASQWSVDTHLLAGVFDWIRIVSWQLQAGKAEMPEPLPRPGSDAAPEDVPVDTHPGMPIGYGVIDAESLTDSDRGGRIVGESASIDDMNAWLGWG